MIQIFKKISEQTWEMVEEMPDESGLAVRLADLRASGGEYRAEKKTSLGSEILDL